VGSFTAFSKRLDWAKRTAICSWRASWSGIIGVTSAESDGWRGE
jgi:hypothetical protein